LDLELRPCQYLAAWNSGFAAEHLSVSKNVLLLKFSEPTNNPRLRVTCRTPFAIHVQLSFALHPPRETEVDVRRFVAGRGIRLLSQRRLGCIGPLSIMDAGTADHQPATSIVGS